MDDVRTATHSWCGASANELPLDQASRTRGLGTVRLIAVDELAEAQHPAF